MSGSSTIPAALAALVNVTKGAVPAGTEVCDGTPVNTDHDLVVIGYSSTDTAQAVSVSVSDADAGRKQPLETYDVTCEASTWRGERTLQGARDAAFALVDDVSDAIDADPRLGKAINGRAFLLDAYLIQDPTTKGAVATVQFVIHVEAWRRP